MSYLQQKVGAFVHGVWNKLPEEEIPLDAASDELNWRHNNGGIEIIGGRQTVGSAGAAGKNWGETVAYQVDGTPVRFRKIGTKIQYMYLTDTDYTDVITGLTLTADYTFSTYQSNAGAFLYIFGIDGIYKIVLANPGSYTQLYNSTNLYRGYGIVDKASIFLWALPTDPAGLYRSYVDAQEYTLVSSESITGSSGTLAFKGSHATATCFGLAMTKNGITYKDNNNGVLVASSGPNGTINYTTGAWTTPSNTTSTTIAYQWEDSNTHGITDFSESSTRNAGEGLVIPMKVKIVTVIPLAGSYFIIQEFTSHQLTIDADDTGYTNDTFRDDIGVQSLRGAVATSLGIVFMNTSNPSRPVVQRLTQNAVGDNFNVKNLFPQFAFENYKYDDAVLETWDQFLVIGCKQLDSSDNDRLLLCNVEADTVDITYYGIRTSAKVNGLLYGGDPVSQSTYELFTGQDDNGNEISNFWDSKGEVFNEFPLKARVPRDVLKKVRKMRYGGQITPGRKIQVYIEADNGGFQLVGTILGNGTYVDYTGSYAIGTFTIGTLIVGGGDNSQSYQFLMEMKVKYGKFRKRKVRFVAVGFGFCRLEQLTDFDIWIYEEKLPAKYRSKQNVNLDGTPNQD